MAERLAGCRFSCIATESRFLPEDKHYLRFCDTRRGLSKAAGCGMVAGLIDLTAT
jgi:hypothetical protein